MNEDNDVAPTRRSKRCAPAPGPSRPHAVTGALRPEVISVSTPLAYGEAGVLRRPLPALPASLAPTQRILDDLRRAGQLIDRAIAPSTVGVYQKNLSYWETYCASVGIAPYPPSPIVVMAWLASMAYPELDHNGEQLIGTGLHPNTIMQRLAALNRACAAQGWARPGDDVAVTELVAGIRRTFGVAPRRRVAALDVEVMRCVLEASRAPSLVQLRDRALIVLLAHPRARAGSLARVAWSEVTISADTVELAQPVQGRGAPTTLRFIATGDVLCPVAAMRELAGHPGVGDSPWVFAGVGSNELSVEHQDDGHLTRAGVHSLLGRAVAAAAVDELDDTTRSAVIAVVMAPRADAVRDRALLLVGLFTAGRRSNICDLVWSDVVFDGPRGVRVRFRRSKTDQVGAGTELWLPFGTTEDTCPVRAIRAWRDHVHTVLGHDPVAGTPDAPVFVPLTRSGGPRLGHHLSGEGFAQVVKRRVAAAGYDPALFAGHSLRVGFITSAATNDARVDQIQAVTGHKNVPVLIGYIRPVQTWKNNPAAIIGL